MTSNFMRDQIYQPLDAAWKEQSDLGVARGVYEQLRQGVEPKSLLEPVDDAICATPGPILHLCKSKLELYQTVEVWKRNTLNEIEALGNLHTTQLSEHLRTKLLSAIATSRQGAEEYGSLLCGIFYARLSQAVMLPVLPLTMPSQLEDLSDPLDELVEQKTHLCDFERLPAHNSTDHLKILLRHEMEKAWDASKHQRSEGGLVVVFKSRVVARKLQEAGLLDRDRQQALCSLMQAFHIEDTGLGKHQKHAHDPEMHQYQNKTSPPRHVHTAMHKLHLRASKANSLAAEEQMKLAHQVLNFVLDDIKKGQCAKDCLVRLQLLSKVSLEAVAEMHKKGARHAVCSEHEAKAMMALVPAAGQVTRHAWLPSDGTDSFLTWPALTEALNEEIPNKATHGQWGRWPGQAPPQLLPAESVASVAKRLKKPPLGYCPMPLDALPAAVHHDLDDCLKVVDNRDSRATYVGPLLDACNNLQQATQTMYDDTPAVVAGFGTSFQDYLGHVVPGHSGLADDLSLSQASLLSGAGFDRVMRNRGQLIVSLAEHLEKPSVPPTSPDQFLVATLAALHSISVEPTYRLESKIEGRSMSTADILADCRSAGKLVSMAMDGEESITDILTAQHDPDPYHSSGIVDTWWALARQKHHITPLRKAVLGEVLAAVKLLLRCQQFSVGTAVAVSGHIRHHLGLDWQHSDGRVYLEHAVLLQLEPLQELLTFLWTHLSLRMQLLEPYIRAHQLLCTPSLDTPLSALDVHPDGTVQFSLQPLQELSTCSPSAYPLEFGSGHETDSRVLPAVNHVIQMLMRHLFRPDHDTLPSAEAHHPLDNGVLDCHRMRVENAVLRGCTLGQETWSYCEKDALAQSALDAMLNSSPGLMSSTRGWKRLVTKCAHAIIGLAHQTLNMQKVHVQIMQRDLNHEKDRLEGIRTACESFMEDSSDYPDYAVLVQDPCQTEDSVHDSLTLNAWTACEERLAEIRKRDEQLQQHSAELESAQVAAEDKCSVMAAAAEGDYGDGSDAIGADASAALKAIRTQASPCYQSLIVRMDAAALTHMFFQKAMRNTCHHLEAALLEAHSTVLKHELIQKAQEHYDHFRTRAADQMMQELVDAENKPHAKKKSKRKKKKKAAKPSDNEQQQEAKLHKELLEQQGKGKVDDDDDDSELECIEDSSGGLGMPHVYTELDTISRVAQDSASSEATGTGNTRKQSHTLSSDQSWSKVDRKKYRRNKGLLTQLDSQLPHFQPMPQSLQNDAVFTPASAPHDWPIQSERGPSSSSKPSLPPAPCPGQEVATAHQSPVHQYLPEISAQSAPPDEQVQPSKLENMSFQPNRAIYTQMARPYPGSKTHQPQTHSSACCNPAGPRATGRAEMQQQPNSSSPAPIMRHKHSNNSMPSQQSYAPASTAASAGHWDAGLKSGQGSSALSSGPWAERNRHKQGLIWQRPDESRYNPDPGMALQASLAGGVQAPAAQVHGIARQVASQQQPASSAQQSAGLHNPTGDLNCFLNVIVQCLWHCTCFRTAVMAWPTAVFQEHEVASALRDLFGQLGDKEQSKNPDQPVDPILLRLALAGLPGARFQVGEMSDAGEVVMALYKQLIPVAIKANQPGLLDHIFGLHVKEEVHCCKCSATTHEHEYVQYFYVVMASGIANQEMLKSGQPLGYTLREIEAQSLKSCDDENGGCGFKNCVLHSLVSQPPKVFTMQLAWQTDNESKQDIKAAMMGLREVLDLADIYLGIEHRAFVYLIRSMVCYYGQHYMAYVLLSDSLWYMFDDARILQIGQWADVVKKCNLGRTQPSILFFEQGGSLQLQA